MFAIPVYVINLKKRADRKAQILEEFAERDEFDVSIVEAQEHPIGALGLWNSIHSIIREVISGPQEYIIICEDDHQFTEHYDKELFLTSISEASELKADIVSGGVAWFNNALPVTENIFWVEKFTGAQFMIIYRRFFEAILGIDFGDGSHFTDHDSLDLKLSALTVNKFFLFPFISVQREFGYSDVTLLNNEKGRVEDYFIRSLNRAKVVKYYTDYYADHSPGVQEEAHPDSVIPTYIIESGASPREWWLNLRKIVALALANKEEMIIVCEDDHEFTEYYSKAWLLSQIMEGYQQGIDILSGGITGFGLAVPVARNRLWVNSFSSTQFLVLYKSVFIKILDADFDEKSGPDEVLSRIARHKMTIFPFISVKRTAADRFSAAEDRLELVQRMHQEGCPDCRDEGHVRARSLPELLNDITAAGIRARSFGMSIAFTNGLQNRHRDTPEARILALIPLHPAGGYTEECYRSITGQSYTNFSLLAPSGYPSALANIAGALTEQELDEEDIIVLVDGGDFLLHNQVFSEINHIYHSLHCLVTYGQYLSANGQPGQGGPYSREEFQRLRSLDWRLSPLKTFKYKIFKEFLRRDPAMKAYKDNKDQLIHLSYDRALMTPLLEIAGFENTYFNSTPVYGYRSAEAFKKVGYDESRKQPVEAGQIAGSPV